MVNDTRFFFFCLGFIKEGSWGLGRGDGRWVVVESGSLVVPEEADDAVGLGTIVGEMGRFPFWEASPTCFAPKFGSAGDGVS